MIIFVDMGKNKFLLEIIFLFFAFNAFSQTTTVTTSICDGDSIFLQGAWQTSAGTYTDVTSSGTVITNLVINPLPVITPNFIFNGTAVVQPGNVFQLTQATNGQAGSVWNNIMINLNQPFSFDVDVFLGCNGGGADGIAFVLQPVSTSLGSTGGGIGYQSISPSFAVEFDTWLNSQYSDPWYNHAAIQKNGNLNHTGPSNLAGPVGFPPTGFSSIEDCQWHKAIFNWDPATTNFTLDFDGVQILNYTGDIVNTIFNGNPNVYWGFTGSTGGANNLQRFRFNYDLPDTTICQNDSIIINSLTTASSFTYNWSPNYNISNNTLAAPLFYPDTTTIYTLDITNTYGCTYTDSFTINVDTTATVTFPSVPQLCVGDSAINLNLSPSGGTLTGSGLIGVNNGFFNPTQNLIGSYNLTYSISNPLTGCSDSKTQSIVVNDTPVLSAVSSNVSTCLGNDGSVDVSVSGGSNPINYAWNNGQTTQDLNNITAGNYSVIATDVNGCQDTISTSITQPSPPTIIFSKSNVSCFGFNDGSIDVTVFGGQSPYSYSWSNGATSEDLNNLSAGFYYLTVTDLNNCVVSQGVVIDQPSEIVINSTTTDVSCFGYSNGNAQLNVSGGVSPYTQNWNGFNPNNLTSGTYSYTVIDSTGCSKNGQITINQPSILNVSSTVNSVTCYNGSNGSVGLNITGGTPPYISNWNGFNPNNLSLGTYSYTVTDFNNCSYTDSVYISQPSPMQVSSTTYDATCYGYNDGYVILNISGGTLPYTQNWGSYDPNNLFAGTYNYDILDSNGCIYSDIITILEPSAVTAVIDTFRASCFGYNDGYVLTSYVGGTPPYVDDWGSFDPNNLSAGTYNFSVTDSSSCVYQFQATISQPDDILINEITSNVSCFGFSDGTATLTISGGTQPYNVDWGGIDINNLSSGIYVYSVNDANGCEKNDFINVTQPDELTVTEIVDEVSCFNYNDGSIFLNISGGTLPYNQNWNGFNPNQLYTGTYSYDVIDANGCDFSSNVFVDQANKILANFSITPQVCENNNATINFDILNPSSNFYYAKIIDADGYVHEFSIDSSGNPFYFDQTLEFIPLTSGEVIFELISDEFGCQSGIFDTSSIIVNPNPTLQMTIDDLCINSSSFELNQAIPTGGIYSINDIEQSIFNTEELGVRSHLVNYYYKDLNTGCSNSISDLVVIYDYPKANISISPSITDSLNGNIYFSSDSERAKYFYWYSDTILFSNQQEFWYEYDRVGEYSINLVVYDDFGCSDSANGNLVINPVFSVFIPNSFTPGDNDQVNNYFGPVTYSESSFIISIYNSWGQKIYESSEFWDGKVDGNFVPPGTYTYYIEVIDFKGKPVDFSGKLQIIR